MDRHALGGNGCVLLSIDLTVASAGARAFEIDASTNGGATFTALVMQAFTANQTNQAFNENISALGSQAGAVSFRFSMYNSQGLPNGAGLSDQSAFGPGGQNLAVNGTLLPSDVPEIDPGSAVSAVTVLGLGVMMLRGRRRPSA